MVCQGIEPKSVTYHPGQFVTHHSGPHLLCVLSALILGRAQPAGAPISGVVELPELQVAGSRYVWKYIKTDNFELYSNLNDIKFIKKFATLLETSHDFVDSQCKGFLETRTLHRKYILCYENTYKDRFSVMQRFYPRTRADLEVQVYTYEERSRRLYSLHQNKRTEEISLKDVLHDIYADKTIRSSMNMKRKVSGSVGIVASDWHWAAWHYIMEHLSEKSALVQRDCKLELTKEEIADSLAASKMSGLAEMLNGFPSAPNWRSRNAGNARVFAFSSRISRAFCFNFVYYCMFGNPGRYRTPLAAYLDWQAKHEPTEEMFKIIFGVDYKTMENEIKEYYAKTYKNKISTLPLINAASKTVKSPEIVVGDVNRSHSSRLLSDAFFVADDDFRARALLLKAVEEHPFVLRDSDFKAALALNELHAKEGDEKKAALWLEELVTMKIQRPRVYAELACQRLKETLLADLEGSQAVVMEFFRSSFRSVTDPFHAIAPYGEAVDWLRAFQRQRERVPSYRLPADGIRRAMEPLETAFPIWQSESLYVMLTAIWFMSDDRPPNNIMEKIKEGCMLYPRNIVMLECALDIFKRYGDMGGVDALLLNSFLHVSERDEAEVVNLAVKTYDIKEPIAERTRDGLKRDQWLRFQEVMQKAKKIGAGTSFPANDFADIGSYPAPPPTPSSPTWISRPRS